ncbi:MAG: hypothetical protein ABW221_04660 [Vicinamibacteria bacterium]
MRPANVTAHRSTLLLAVLPTPLLVLASAHELYLRNQRELDGAVSVLVPFWLAAAALAALGAVLTALARRPWARVALVAYHAAGGTFLVYSLLRASSWGGHLAAWVFDQTAGALLVLAVYGAAVALFARRDPRAIARPLALFAAVLLAQEAFRLGSRLAPAPGIAEPAAAPDLGATDPRLPNVYHLVLDAFQPDIFDLVWPHDAPLDGFVYFRGARALYGATVPSMSSTFLSLRAPRPNAMAEALASPDSLPARLRTAGYRTVAYLPPSVYPDQSRAWDAVVWHEATLPPGAAAELHRSLFARLWLATTLPTGPVDRLLGRNIFGLAADDMRDLRNQRLSTLTQPIVTLLSFERFLRDEPQLPAAGRYTLVHLLVPHNPFVLTADCSQREVRRGTDVLAQSGCAALVMRRFLDRLRGLERMEGSVVVVQSDHGSYVRFESRASQQENSALWLLKTPGAGGPLVRRAEEVSLLDLTPTLLQVLGLPLRPSYEGRPLLAAHPHQP